MDDPRIVQIEGRGRLRPSFGGAPRMEPSVKAHVEAMASVPPKCDHDAGTGGIEHSELCTAGAQLLETFRGLLG